MAIYHVDYAVGDNGTGDGSSGSPWKTIQYALDNGTWATTAANTLRVGDNAAEILTSSINFDGSVAKAEAPLVVEGWDNGGSLTATLPFGQTVPCGEIDGNDAVAYICDFNTAYVTFVNMKMHSTTGVVLPLSSWSNVIKCEVYNGNSVTVQGLSGWILNSYIHTDNTTGIQYNTKGMHVEGCEIRGGTVGIQANVLGGSFKKSLVHGFEDAGIVMAADNILVSNNTIDGIDSNSDARGIECLSNLPSYEHAKIFNNLITNFSGATAKGIYIPTGAPPSIIGNNAYYNNTTDADTPTPGYAPADVAESSDPFTDSAGDDYSLVSGANASGAAIITNQDADNPDNIGAWQDYSSGGGGGGSGVSFYSF